MLKIGNDNEDVGTDKDKIRYHCISIWKDGIRNGEWRDGLKHKGSTQRITSKDLCTAEAVAIDCCWRS